MATKLLTMEWNTGVTVLLLIMLGLSESWAIKVHFNDSVRVNESQHTPQKNSSVTRIYGGTEMQPNEMPFLALIVYDYSANEEKQVCSGTIISPNYVLTAGHCFPRYVPTRSFSVIAGEHSFQAKENTEQRRRVSKVVFHTSYVHGKLNNDVAMVRLSSPLTLNGQVAAVKLNTDRHCPATDASCTVAGWGSTETVYEHVDKPRKVTIPISSPEKCENAYKTNYDDDKQLCGNDSGKDACRGDSGGPLMCRCGRSLSQVGVVSFGVICGKTSHPEVYSRVSTYASWIAQVQRDGGKSQEDRS